MKVSIPVRGHTAFLRGAGPNLNSDAACFNPREGYQRIPTLRTSTVLT